MFASKYLRLLFKANQSYIFPFTLTIHSCYLSNMNQLRLRTSLSLAIQTHWSVPHFCFVVTSHTSLVLLYHNLTPTTIKGLDIERLDIREQWWTGCEQDFLWDKYPSRSAIRYSTVYFSLHKINCLSLCCKTMTLSHWISFNLFVVKPWQLELKK